MQRLKLAASKIPIELMERLNRLTELTGLTQSALIRQAIEQYLDSTELTGLSKLTTIEGNLTPSQLVTTDNPVNSRFTEIEARLERLEGQSVTHTVKPTAKPIAGGTKNKPKPIATATKNPPTPTPIAGAGVGAFTTGEAHAFLYARKLYKKQLAAFRTALRRARESDPAQLPDELAALGLSADFETRAKANNPKDNQVKWLRVEQADLDS